MLLANIRKPMSFTERTIRSSRNQIDMTMATNIWVTKKVFNSNSKYWAKVVNTRLLEQKMSKFIDFLVGLTKKHLFALHPLKQQIKASKWPTWNIYFSIISVLISLLVPAQHWSPERTDSVSEGSHIFPFMLHLESFKQTRIGQEAGMVCASRSGNCQHSISFNCVQLHLTFLSE